MEDKMNLIDINNEISRFEFTLDYGEALSQEEQVEYERLLQLRKEKVKELAQNENA